MVLWTDRESLLRGVKYLVSDSRSCRSVCAQKKMMRGAREKDSHKGMHDRCSEDVTLSASIMINGCHVWKSSFDTFLSALTAFVYDPVLSLGAAGTLPYPGRVYKVSRVVEDLRSCRCYLFCAHATIDHQPYRQSVVSQTTIDPTCPTTDLSTPRPRILVVPAQQRPRHPLDLKLEPKPTRPEQPRNRRRCKS